MTDKKWNAILAVNLIARNCESEYVLERLKEIQAYLGTANLPDCETEFNHARKGVCHP